MTREFPHQVAARDPLLQPDLGAFGVIVAIAMGILFLGGVNGGGTLQPGGAGAQWPIGGVAGGSVFGIYPFDAFRRVEVNAGLYVADAEFLWSTLSRVDAKNAQREFYLTDLVALAADGPGAVPDEAVRSRAQRRGHVARDGHDLAALLEREARRDERAGALVGLDHHDDSRERGDDPDYLGTLYGDLINTAISDIPADMTVTMHLCRGNFQSTFVATGGYEPVAEILFNTINVHGYFMEYDSARAGGFEPLRLVPKDRCVVLGLVTTKTGRLEAKDELKRCIDEAAKYISLDQLCLSPQCGFASTEEGNVLAEDEQWAKLRMIVEVAEEVWGK